MQVLGIREDRNYKTPALQAAKERAKLFVVEAYKRTAPIIDTRIQALLNEEHRSVIAQYTIFVRAALRGPSHFTRPDETIHGSLVWKEEPGGRRWDQRSMAIAAGLSPRIGIQAMKRLAELGLIEYEVVPGRCTYVFVKNLTQLVGTMWWRVVALGLDFGKKLKRRAEASETSGVSPSDTFPPRPNVSRSLTSTVDVSATESKAKKEGDTLQKIQIPEKARLALLIAKAGKRIPIL